MAEANDGGGTQQMTKEAPASKANGWGMRGNEGGSE